MQQHLSMFKKSDNELGYVQCVISAVFVDEFKSLGFVESIEKINDEGDSILSALKTEAKALGIKGYGKMGLDTLKAKITEKRNDSDEGQPS